MSMPSFTQDPSSKLDYVVNWAAWLGTDQILTSDWTSDDPTAVLSGETSTPTTATVYVAFPGEEGALAIITNHITTVGGREHDQSFKLKLRSQ